MKKIIVIFIGLLFMTIGGCQKKFSFNFGKKINSATNDIYTELIKDDMNSISNNEIINTNISLTEPIKDKIQTNEEPKVKESTKLPVEPEVGMNALKDNQIVEKKPEKNEKVIPSKGNKVYKEKEIKDEAIEVPEKEKSKVSTKGNVIIKIGDDLTDQTASPRKYIKMTFVVLGKGKSVKYCDFKIYALPVGKKSPLSYDYLIGAVKNVDVINGQAQFTKYWNGMNNSQIFMPKDDYNIYISYKLKDSKFEVLKKEGRYWLKADKYYIKLN